MDTTTVHHKEPRHLGIETPAYMVKTRPPVADAEVVTLDMLETLEEMVGGGSVPFIEESYGLIEDLGRDHEDEVEE